jgi:ADP-ribose pyrophosphatase
MTGEEKKISGETKFIGHIFRVELDSIELPDGKPAFREVVRHPGACCVVPLTDDGCVICVRQFRYPFYTETLEIPAGKLDKGDAEHPSGCARRELKEETGASADELVFLGEYWPSPAILDEKIYMYLARGLRFGNTDFDDGEFISVDRIPLDRLTEMIMNGEIKDGKTQAAILKTRLWLQKNL